MPTIKDLLARSHKAVCGAAEREVIVSDQNVGAAIRTIKEKGFQYVGKGPHGTGTTKIWFVKQGLGLL